MPHLRLLTSVINVRRFHIWTNVALVTSTLLSHLPSSAAPGPSSGPIMIISQLFQNYLNTHRRWVRGNKASSHRCIRPQFLQQSSAIFPQSPVHLSSESQLCFRPRPPLSFKHRVLSEFPFPSCCTVCTQNTQRRPSLSCFGPPLVFRFPILPTFPYCEDRMPVCDERSLAGPGPG